MQELPGMAGQMKASVREGLRQGVAGAVRDLQVGWLSIECCSAFAGTGRPCGKWRSGSFCRRGLSCARPRLLPPASVRPCVRPGSLCFCLTGTSLSFTADFLRGPPND